MSAHRGRALVVTAFLLLGALTGCAGDRADLASSTANRLQSEVLEVSTKAASGDFPGAQSSLSALQADLLTAAAAGQVTAERSAKIQSAINLVSADLAAAIAASTPAPAPAPAVTVEAPAPTDSGGEDSGNGNSGNGKPGKGNDKPPKEDKPGKGEGAGATGTPAPTTPAPSPTTQTTDGPSTPPISGG
jgi:uncharacterized low-complexity protein